MPGVGLCSSISASGAKRIGSWPISSGPPTNRRTPAERPPPSYYLDFIDQNLGGKSPAGPHCAVIYPRGLTRAGDGRVDMILYLHGWKASCADPKKDPNKDPRRDPKQYTMRQMLHLDYFKSIPSTVGDSRKNVVFVAPTLGPKGEVGPDDTFLPDQPWQLLNDAYALVHRRFGWRTSWSGKVILAGHSGAGPRILKLLDSKDPGLSRVIAVWAIDAFYGGTGLWRRYIELYPGFTWTIVPSTGSDVNGFGIAINAAQGSKKLVNQRYIPPNGDHCHVVADNLGKLLADETGLTMHPPPPPAQRSPSESVVVAEGGRRLTGALSVPPRRRATSRLIDEAERFYQSLVGR